MTVAANPAACAGWKANLSLCFTKRIEKTIISSLSHVGPLRVQRPFYPESDVCHVYLLHPPGGVVGGDSIDIQVQTLEDSHALLTSPGSTKFYRSAGEIANVTQHLSLQQNSVLEWFPQENILFPGAKVKLQTQIHLSSDADFIGWEMNCLGRPANQERFDFGELDTTLKIFRKGELLLLERQRVNQQRHLSAAAGLRNYPMNAIFFCTSCNEEHVNLAREVVSRLSPGFPVGVTRIEDVLVLRLLGVQAEPMRQLMIAVWQVLRPLIINKPAVLPRIWST